MKKIKECNLFNIAVSNSGIMPFKVHVIAANIEDAVELAAEFARNIGCKNVSPEISQTRLVTSQCVIEAKNE